MGFRAVSCFVAFAITACRPSPDGVPTLVPTPSLPPPPLRFTLVGTVSESGGGPALEGVSIQAPVLPRGMQQTKTDTNGAFQLMDLPVGSYVTFRKPGFEDLARTFALDGRPIDARLQRRLEFSANDNLTATLYPDDPFYEYWLGDASCEPCKRIHVTVPQEGTIDVGLGSAPADLCFWVERPDTGSLLSGRCGQGERGSPYPASTAGLTVIVYSKSPVNEPVTFQIYSRMPSGGSD
jgi:hypothetical protein